MRRRTTTPLLVVTYLLMLPELCEAYRRLQSGKRHARLDPDEMLDLLVELPPKATLTTLAKELETRRGEILHYRREALAVRAAIDDLF